MRPSFRKLAAKLLAATCLAVPLTMIAQTAAAPLMTPPTTLSTTIVIPQRVLDIYRNAAEICGPITGGARNPVIEQRIQNFNRVMNQSQTGRDLINTAARYDSQPAWMCFANIKGLHAAYYINKGVIAVGMNKTNDEIVADSAHELRHLFQEKAGAYRVALNNNQDRIHAEYASEADAEATASLVMWELKQAGQTGPWAMHNNPFSYGPRSICYAHISTAFQHAVESGATPPAATREAFRTWYKDRSLLSFYKSSALEGIDTSAKPASTQDVHARTVSATSCQDDEPERQTRGYEIPSDYIVRQLDGITGHLPSYNINYIQQGGGLKAILQGP